MTNKETTGNSLVVQPLGLYAFTAGSIGSIPSQGTSIPQATLEAKKKEDTLKNSMELTQHGLLLHSCSCNDNYLSFFFFLLLTLVVKLRWGKCRLYFLRLLAGLCLLSLWRPIREESRVRAFQERDTECHSRKLQLYPQLEGFVARSYLRAGGTGSRGFSPSSQG